MAIWVTAMNCVRWLQAESSLIHLNNQLEQTVFERTQRLAMQSSVANVLRGSDKWDTALPNTLNVICQEMKWQVGIYSDHSYCHMHIHCRESGWVLHRIY